MHATVTHLKKNRLFTGIIAAAFVAVLGFSLFRITFAASGSVYLSPSSKTVEKGDTVSFSVRVNPGTSINGISVSLHYDTSKLQYSSYSISGSAFSTQPVGTSVSGGVISSDQVRLGSSVSSDSLVATVKFKALAGSGSASLSLSGSNATADGSYTDPSTGSGTVNFTTPASSGGSSGSSGGSTGSSSGSSSSSSSSSGGKKSSSSKPDDTKKSSTPTSVTVTNQEVQFTEADVTVTSKEPTKVYVRYGVDGKLTMTGKESEFATSHKIQINPADLVPGQEYSYVVVSINKQGVTTTSKVQTFKTKGLDIEVGVYDKNHKPIKKQTVTLHSEPMTTKTDDNGIATFKNVAPGEHSVTYTAGGKEYTSELYVANNVKTVNGAQTAPVQNLSVVYDLEQQGGWAPAPWTIGLLVLLVVAGGGFYVYRQRKPFAAVNSPVASTIVTSSGNPATPQDGEVKPVSSVPYPSAPQPGSTVAPQDGETRKEP